MSLFVCFLLKSLNCTFSLFMYLFEKPSLPAVGSCSKYVQQLDQPAPDKIQVRPVSGQAQAVWAITCCLASCVLTGSWNQGWSQGLHSSSVLWGCALTARPNSCPPLPAGLGGRLITGWWMLAERADSRVGIEHSLLSMTSSWC